MLNKTAFCVQHAFKHKWQPIQNQYSETKTNELMRIGVGNFLMTQKGLWPQRISLHGHCIYALYIAHCIIRTSKETCVSEDSARQIIWAAFKRGGNG